VARPLFENTGEQRQDALHGQRAIPRLESAELREPQHDVVLGQWLQGVLQAADAAGPPVLVSRTASTATASVTDATPADAAITPRRWDDATLADFAALSSTIACECPRHVVELLMQLAHFESYSAECRQRVSLARLLLCRSSTTSAAAVLKPWARLTPIAASSAY
jgi:hypothetical protein